ncbi:hypothetical protein Pelo_1064 [Pelomyxa schiedti]|nr:hypothetical protein Pelo_1064 [Pelomyxa schiedti]
MAALAAGTHPRCRARSPVRIMGPSLLESMYRICWDPKRSAASRESGELWGTVVTVCVGVHVGPLSSDTEGDDDGCCHSRGGGSGVVPSSARKLNVSAPLVGATSGGGGSVPTDVFKIELSAPLLGVMSVKKLDHRKSLGTSTTEEGDFPQTFMQLKPNCMCERWDLVGSNGECIIKRPNTNGENTGSFYFFPAPPVIGCDQLLLPEGEASTYIGDEDGFDELDIESNDAYRVVQLFVSEVNSNELVIAAVARSTLFLVIDVKHTLKTGNLTVVSRTTCSITDTSDDGDSVSAIMCRQQSGQRVFVVQAHSCTSALSDDVHLVNENTGVGKLVTTGVSQLCHISPSLFCTSHRSVHVLSHLGLQ